MRRLLAPLTRWLDRRIDARIAAAKQSDLDAFMEMVERNRRQASAPPDADECRAGSWMGA